MIKLRSRTHPFPPHQLAQSRFGLKFNVVLLLTLLVTACAVIGFNYWIDPYGIFGQPVITSLNQLKSEKSNRSRLFKAADVVRQKPKTILLGTSTVDFGMDADHPTLSTYAPSYNLAMLGANAYEILHYLKHAAYNQPNLKRVIIGLDFVSFQKANVNKIDYDEARLETSHLPFSDFLNSTFSIESLMASLKTIQESQKSTAIPPYSLNGNRSENWSATQEPQIYIFMRTLAKVLAARIQKQDTYLQNFREIVEFCRDRNIEIQAFFTPIHATLTEAYYVSDQMRDIMEIQRQLVKILPIWDFAGFNSITTEPIREVMQNYLDSMHYRKKLGDLMLRKMLAPQDKSVPSDFGELLTSSNIEQHLAKLHQDWLKWRKDNPKLVEMVHALQRAQGM